VKRGGIPFLRNMLIVNNENSKTMNVYFLYGYGFLFAYYFQFLIRQPINVRSVNITIRAYI